MNEPVLSIVLLSLVRGAPVFAKDIVSNWSNVAGKAVVSIQGLGYEAPRMVKLSVWGLLLYPLPQFHFHHLSEIRYEVMPSPLPVRYKER